MRIKEVVVSRSAKVNLGNYESTDVFASLKLELEDEVEEFSAEDYKEVQAHVRQLVLDEVEHVVREKGLGVKDGKVPSRRAIGKRWGLGQEIKQ